MRNTPDPLTNIPHMVDGINAIPTPVNGSFLESVEMFARWRRWPLHS